MDGVLTTTRAPTLMRSATGHRGLLTLVLAVSLILGIGAVTTHQTANAYTYNRGTATLNLSRYESIAWAGAGAAALAWTLFSVAGAMGLAVSFGTVVSAAAMVMGVMGQVFSSNKRVWIRFRPLGVGTY